METNPPDGGAASPPTLDPSNESGGLQFDRPEYISGQPEHGNCAICSQPLLDYYYTLNDKVLCPGCRERAEALEVGGSGFRRFARAFVFGSAAAALGSVIHYAIMKATGYELALITILIGYMVGMAVKKGCNARGGWVYQLLAVLLTYVAIVSTYIPTIIQGVRDQNDKDHPGKVEKRAKKARKTDPGKGAGTDEELSKQVAEETKQFEQDKADKTPSVGVADDPKGEFKDGSLAARFGIAALALIFLLILAMAIPVIAGFSSPILLLIIIFGLWEAWKINRRLVLAFGGPFHVSAGLMQSPPSQGA